MMFLKGRYAAVPICDLHTHSTFSDGTDTPSMLTAQAKEKSLIVALTDHNTVDGLAEFMEQAQRLGVTAVGGTELSADHNGTEFHLLGLFIDPDKYKRVGMLTKEFRLLKEISNMETVERLAADGYCIDYLSVKKRSANDNANRVQIAEELMEKGYVRSISEAFETLLNEESGYYKPSEHLQLTDAVKFLREIKAVPIIAHPLKDTDEETLRSILPELIEAGLLGIEAFHSSYSDEKITASLKIAEDFGLFVSGGSDYHGKNKPDINLGEGKGNLAIPESIYLRLKALKESL